MRSFRDSDGLTLAVALERGEQPEDHASVIDLVQLPPGSRPLPFALLEYEEVSRCRVLSCGSYDECLSFAARVQWVSFSCRQCPKYRAGTQRTLAIGADDDGTARVGPRPAGAIIKLR